MRLGSLELEWVSDLKYLGRPIVFKIYGPCLKVDVSYIKLKFYTSCNSVLNHCKSVDDIIKLAMVKWSVFHYWHILSRCPLLDKTTCSGPAGSLLEWLFKTYIKLRYNRYESVKYLQFFCSELPLELLYDLANLKYLFYTSHVPVSIRILFTLQNHAMSDLTKNMDMLSLDILWNV